MPRSFDWNTCMTNMCQLSFSFDFLMDQQPSKTTPYGSPFHSNWVPIDPHFDNCRSPLHVEQFFWSVQKYYWLASTHWAGPSGIPGSRDLQSAKIKNDENPGIFKTEIPGFFGIFCCYVLDPLERSLALRQSFFFFTFSALPSPYSLTERGQHTKTNINTLSSQASSLRRHLKTHSGEKSNECNQCDYASSQAGHLRRHLKTHSGEKSNKCNQCDFVFSHADHLKRKLK